MQRPARRGRVSIDSNLQRANDTQYSRALKRIEVRG